MPVAPGNGREFGPSNIRLPEPALTTELPCRSHAPNVSDASAATFSSVGLSSRSGARMECSPLAMRISAATCDAYDANVTLSAPSTTKRLASPSK